MTIQGTPRLGHSVVAVPNLPGAACLGRPIEWFFPDEDKGRPGPHLLDVLRHTAELYCGQCPVRRECRAAGEGTSWGLWGGVWRRPHADPIDLLAEVAS